MAFGCDLPFVTVAGAAPDLHQLPNSPPPPEIGKSGTLQVADNPAGRVQSFQITTNRDPEKTHIIMRWILRNFHLIMSDDREAAPNVAQRDTPTLDIEAPCDESVTLPINKRHENAHAPVRKSVNDNLTTGEDRFFAGKMANAVGPKYTNLDNLALPPGAIATRAIKDSQRRK